MPSEAKIKAILSSPKHPFCARYMFQAFDMSYLVPTAHSESTGSVVSSQYITAVQPFRCYH